jgi:hypothetical protein
VPFSLTGTIKHINAKIIVSLAGPPSEVLWLGFKEEPTIDVAIDTEIGLSDITSTFGMTACPKRVGEIITQLLKYQIFSEMVSPHRESILLPKPNNTVKRNRFVNWRWESEDAKNSLIKLRKPMKSIYTDENQPTIDREDIRDIKTYTDPLVPTVSSADSSPVLSRHSSLSKILPETRTNVPQLSHTLEEEDSDSSSSEKLPELMRAISLPQPLPEVTRRNDFDSLSRRYQSMTSSQQASSNNQPPVKSSFDNLSQEFADAIGLTSEDVESVKSKFSDGLSEVWKLISENKKEN